MNKKQYLLIILALSLLAGVVAYWNARKDEIEIVNDFDECAKAGYQVMESYPAQCRMPDGRTFIQEIGNETKGQEEEFSPGEVTSGDNAPPGGIHNLPVPAGVAAARQALATRLSIDSKNILILTAFEKDWPNSCLGLEETGEFCAQVIVPGFEVMLKAQGQTYIYRTNSDGSAVRAEN